MANFIRNTQVKAITSIWTAKQKARELADRTAEALTDRTGQGTLDVAITVLISIVLGALILAGLYLIVDSAGSPMIGGSSNTSHPINSRPIISRQGQLRHSANSGGDRVMPRLDGQAGVEQQRCDEQREVWGRR